MVEVVVDPTEFPTAVEDTLVEVTLFFVLVVEPIVVVVVVVVAGGIEQSDPE